MILPEEHHAAALAEAHYQPHAGHLGVDKKRTIVSPPAIIGQVFITKLRSTLEYAIFANVVR